MSSWLSKNTGGKFTSAPEMDADTVFAIISALCFKDSWVDPLDDEDIEVVFRAPEPQSDVAMMGGFGSYGHLLSTREAIAVSWPMQSGAVLCSLGPTMLRRRWVCYRPSFRAEAFQVFS